MDNNDALKLAILEEQTKHLSKTTDEMKNDLKEISNDVKKIVHVIEKVEDIEKKAERNSETLVKHVTIGRVLIFLVTLCSGLIGWSYSQLEQLKQKDEAIKERVQRLEILNNVKDSINR
ncbi:hypothetical protein FDJ62_gp49 [Acinetobacter phage Loki]|uniref:Uncharacterized protein n=1 Tax=Acinetobacter phage Loki TaxID=1970374 RepID=A0A0P1KLF8_9CAUD|nr:hypothetical protein FDJ62_gp49 [Acinetobacter phage Loki]CUS06510.1 hypothetical protein [Acinetobacter phage Loki]